MRKNCASFLVFCLLFSLILVARASALQVDVIGLCFSPNGGCTNMVVNQIDHAQREIRVMAYSFTSAPIGKALIRAKRRGVDVQVIEDNGEATHHWSEAGYLVRASIPVYLDTEAGIYHDKVMVIDEGTVIEGSFNWSAAAEFKNAENLLVIQSPELARYYLQNWYQHQKNDPLMSRSAVSGQTGLPSLTGMLRRLLR